MPKTIRTLNKSSPRWKPYPWSRFSADEFPREAPLPICPDAKCRRAKTCLAAHLGLYCQRTHFSSDEGPQRIPKTEVDKQIANIMLPPLEAGIDLRMAYHKDILDLRMAEQQEKVRLWRAGAYGEKYGPYRAKGYMKEPPPKQYTEECNGRASGHHLRRESCTT